MNANELGEVLGKKLESMNPAAVSVLNPHQTIELGLLQNILGMLSVLAQQNAALIKHLVAIKLGEHELAIAENNPEIRGEENSGDGP